ncbi:hypothetical protein I4U23_021762 [Adineta vaga]|nr:hypothetical protein I4U23_021762 [Adineta vaga]
MSRRLRTISCPLYDESLLINKSEETKYPKNSISTLPVIKEESKMSSKETLRTSTELIHLNGIGLNYYRKSQYDLSIEYYSKCLDFLLKHLKISNKCDHQKEIVSCLIDLSCVYIDKKDYQIALKNLEKISQILPENHKDLPNSYLFIGLCYMEQKQYEIAVQHFNIAIQHYEKHLPFNEENYALCFSHLGTCYSNMAKHLFDNGIHSILKAIDIYENHYPEQKSNIAQCYWTYAFILSKKGKYDEAILNLYKSLEFRLNEDSLNIVCMERLN